MNIQDTLCNLPWAQNVTPMLIRCPLCETETLRSEMAMNQTGALQGTAWCRCKYLLNIPPSNFPTKKWSQSQPVIKWVGKDPAGATHCVDCRHPFAEKEKSQLATFGVCECARCGTRFYTLPTEAEALAKTA